MYTWRARPKSKSNRTIVPHTIQKKMYKMYTKTQQISHLGSCSFATIYNTQFASVGLFSVSLVSPKPCLFSLSFSLHSSAFSATDCILWYFIRLFVARFYYFGNVNRATLFPQFLFCGLLLLVASCILFTSCLPLHYFVICLSTVLGNTGTISIIAILICSWYAFICETSKFYRTIEIEWHVMVSLFCCLRCSNGLYNEKELSWRHFFYVLFQINIAYLKRPCLRIFTAMKIYAGTWNYT